MFDIEDLFTAVFDIENLFTGVFDIEDLFTAVFDIEDLFTDMFDIKELLTIWPDFNCCPYKTTHFKIQKLWSFLLVLDTHWLIKDSLDRKKNKTNKEIPGSKECSPNSYCL
mgnify:CR=1 FL=1